MGFLKRILVATFRAILTEWFLSTSLPEARKLLEKNLQLLCTESEQMLQIIVKEFTDDTSLSHEQIAKLIEVRDSNIFLLRRAMVGGKTRQAVRDAYIDQFSALRVLDLPNWFSAFTRPLNVGYYIVETDNPVPASIRNAEGNLVLLLRDLIARTHSFANLEPEVLADLQLIQGTLLMDEDLSSAIELLTGAARVFCQQRFPKRFALVRKNLGLSYFSKMELGHNDDDVLCAIVCFEDSLGYYTFKIDAKQWCKQKFCLAECYHAFGDYDRARQNLHELLSTLPPSHFPELFQAVQKRFREIEEMLQRYEELMDLMDLSMPKVIEMHREKDERDRVKKLRKLQYFREQFSRLCTRV